jgi:hypothetical protein
MDVGGQPHALTALLPATELTFLGRDEVVSLADLGNTAYGRNGGVALHIHNLGAI